MFTRLLLTGTLCGLVCRGVRFSTGSFGLNGSRECMFETNSGCDCHFSGDNLIIQKERFLYIVVSYRLVFTRLLLTGTLCGLVCRGVRFSTGSFGLNGSREYLSGDDCTQTRVYEYMSSNGPCQRLKLLPLRTCFTWERRCLRTEIASRTTIWLNFF